MQSRLISIYVLVSLVSLSMPATLTAQTVWRSSSVPADKTPPADTSFRSFGGRRHTPMTPFAADSARPRSRRGGIIIGGVLGAIVGGVAAAGYVLNATAYDCVTIGPPCPYDRHTTRRVATIALGTAGGAFLGAWLGHHISATRAH